MKYCPKCEQDLPLDNFGNRSHTKDGKAHWCKVCHNDSVKAHNKTEEGRLKATQRAYLYRQTEGGREVIQRGYKKNATKIIQQTTDYKKNNPDKVKIYAKRNNEKRTKNGKNNLWLKEKLTTDLDFKLRRYLRTRVWRALKGVVKSAATQELLGCTIEFFKVHLESQFTEGMSWDNYGKGEGKWEVDHIVPCDYFDLTDTLQQQLCFHWTNQRPLWWRKNQQKSNKLTPEAQELLGIS